MKGALLVSLLVALAAPASFAQGGINLTWYDCRENPGAASAVTFACNTNTGSPFTMVFSVYAPAELPQFTSADVYIDVITDSYSTPPPWWQTATGQCRQGAISASFDPNGFPGLYCADIWGGAATVAVYQVQAGSVANAFRIRALGALPAPSPVTAEMVGTELNVCTVSISRMNTTGDGSCAGCTTGACFLGSQCVLHQAPGAGDYTLSTPATDNLVLFNAQQTLCVVPTRNRTWGQVKSLYR